MRARALALLQRQQEAEAAAAARLRPQQLAAVLAPAQLQEQAAEVLEERLEDVLRQVPSPGHASLSGHASRLAQLLACATAAVTVTTRAAAAAAAAGRPVPPCWLPEGCLAAKLQLALQQCGNQLAEACKRLEGILPAEEAGLRGLAAALHAYQAQLGSAELATSLTRCARVGGARASSAAWSDVLGGWRAGHACCRGGIAAPRLQPGGPCPRAASGPSPSLGRMPRPPQVHGPSGGAVPARGPADARGGGHAGGPGWVGEEGSGGAWAEAWAEVRVASRRTRAAGVRRGAAGGSRAPCCAFDAPRCASFPLRHRRKQAVVATRGAAATAPVAAEWLDDDLDVGGRAPAVAR